ncbi:hypothetical protein PYCC9005_005069 [Savitreella phatthalungensis]
MSNQVNTEGLDQTSNDTYVQNKVNAGNKNADGGRLATDTIDGPDSNNGAVGNSGNSLVDDLIAGGPEKDSLANMAASGEAQKSDLTHGKTTVEGNPSGNPSSASVGGNSSITNQEGNINADLNHGPGRQGRV